MSESTRASPDKAAAVSWTPARGPRLQRKCACGQHTVAGGECTECRKKRLSLQRRAANQAEPTTVPPIVHEVLHSPGQPLGLVTRAFMESRFGHDFSRVRVHTDAKAAESARAVNAVAYTVGRDVVFEDGQYRPGSSDGRRLLAHELTHIVQQGGLSKQAGALRIGEADSSQEREAAYISRQVASGTAEAGTGARPTLSAPAGLLQRESPLDWFRREILEEYQIDITVISPRSFPVAGTPRIGARRNRDGTWTVVVGNERRTVGADEIDDILRDMGSLSRSGGESDRGGPTLPTTPASPFDPTMITNCRPDEYFDFIRLRCVPEISLPEPRFRLTPPELRLPTRPRLTLTGRESVTIDHFALNGATMPAGVEARLDRLVSLLASHDQAEVHIDGHTDSSGTERHNQGLSERRAEAVRDELVRRGVPNPRRLQVRGFGETLLENPDERTDEERAENRRVEVWFMLPAGETAERFRLRLGDITPPSVTGE